MLILQITKNYVLDPDTSEWKLKHETGTVSSLKDESNIPKRSFQGGNVLEKAQAWIREYLQLPKPGRNLAVKEDVSHKQPYNSAIAS